MSFINQEEIFAKTDGGLDIILKYYPQAASCMDNNRKFKLRTTEKTASATLKRLRDGNWVVTDFGGDQKPRNAIAIVQEEEKVDFKTACQLIGEQFGILPENAKNELLAPKINQRNAEPEEQDGTWTFQQSDFTERDLRVLFADQVIAHVQEQCEKSKGKEDWQTVLATLCRKYFMYKLEFYTVTSNRKVTTIASTEHYPIFVFEVSKDIKKIYQPLAQDKSKRFSWYGGKPAEHIFGYSQALKAFTDYQEQQMAEASKESQEDEDENAPAERKLKKLDEVILCSGGSDGLNVAAMGYQVVWLNSEGAKLNGSQYVSITKLCEKFCILPDIDATGKRTAHELCMIYLDIHTIVLPASLSTKKDRRGKPCKDVRDYFKYYKFRDFRKLVEASLPYRFWDEVKEYDRKGNFKGIGYECNNTHLYWFLSQNGFYQYTTKNETDIYIQIVGNTVREVDPKKIRKYVNEFLADRSKETELRNKFYKSNQLNATSFENLPHIVIDFTDYTIDSQLMFFKNQTWEIHKNSITKYKPGELAKYVWEKEVINHRVELLDDFFKIEKDENDDYQLQILNSDCLFFKFVQNSCKMHWRVEEMGVDDGNGGIRKVYNEKEIHEHNQHIINRIFTLGYLLHKFKEPSSSWAVWCMENDVIEEGASEGRSGKSIFLKYPRYFMNYIVIGARSQAITENKHLLENVTEFTDYVLFDDCNEYLKFDFFFPLITGSWTINPKNTKSFTLDEADAPKLAFSSNFAPKADDSSSLDRLIFCVFSDYYHSGPSERHPERRTPKDEFGKNLFLDFNDEEWNRALNFGAQCVKFYLNVTEKINPPMNNVTLRQLLGIMTEVFKNWADVYFSQESGRLNFSVVKEEAQEDCLKKNNLKWTSNKFGKSLRAWCKYYGYELNPASECNSGKRIIKKMEDGSTKEMIFIKANQLRLDLPVAQPKTSTPAGTDGDDMPF